MTKGLVSIVVPCYNGEEFLDDAMTSILWQTYPDWECILIDDGSTDRSGVLFGRYVREDPRFRYHRQGNRGLAAARNRGIGLAQGEFIQFLDVDDIMLDTKLQLSIERFRDEPTSGIVYSDYVCFAMPNVFYHYLPCRIPSDDPLRAYVTEWNRSFVTPVHTFMFRRETMRANLFDETMRSHAEDWDCWIRIAATKPRYEYLDEVLVIYRQSAGTLVSKESTLIEAKLRVLKRYENDPAFREYQTHIQHSRADVNERLAIAFFMEKDFVEGRLLMKEAWRNAPWPARFKMLGWFFLMTIFDKQSVARFRMWVVKTTPFKWGGWSHYREWLPPEAVRKLMVS